MTKMTKLKVDELKLRQTYGAMMIWERVMGKPFKLDGSMTALIVYVWAIIEANNQGTIGMSDFLEWVDDNPAEWVKMLDWLRKDQERLAELMGKDDDSEKEVKKKRGSKKCMGS